jgi:hypothetical protein
MTTFNEKLTRANVVKECALRYSVKDRRVNGLIHIISLKEDNIVVKKTKTYEKAVGWVLEKVKEELRGES